VVRTAGVGVSPSGFKSCVSASSTTSATKERCQKSLPLGTLSYLLRGDGIASAEPALGVGQIANTKPRELGGIV